MSRAALLARLERERLLTLERRGKARLEAREVAEGVAESVALSRARGAAIVTPQVQRGEREKPYRRMSGLDWLVRRGRLSEAQKAVGERYGACYRQACGEVNIGSTLDVKPGLGMADGLPLTTVVAQAEANLMAAERLARYRRRLHRQPALIAACDRICGEELTPREAAGPEREAYALEGVLRVALDMLGEGRTR
jgi:hypothetical protein